MSTRIHSGESLWRRFAAGLSLVWIVGLLYCQTQCLVAANACHVTQSNGSTPPPCHGPAAGTEDPQQGMDCCCAVDLMVQASEKMESHVSTACLLPCLLEIPWADLQHPEERMHGYLEHADWLEWTRPPVLRLGPAIYSHAPPSIEL